MDRRLWLPLFLAVAWPSLSFAQPYLLGSEGILPLRMQDVSSTVSRVEISLPAEKGRLLAFCSTESLFPLLSPLLRGEGLRDVLIVLPSGSPLTPEMAEMILRFLEDGGVSEADRKGFSSDNGAFRGTIEGKKVSFRPLVHIPPFGGRRLLLVDPLFLRELYRDEVNTPMVGLARKWLATLRDLDVTTSVAVLYEGTGREGFPLELGYLPRLVAEMLANPGEFTGGLPEKWKYLADADYLRYFEQVPEALALYRKYLSIEPGDPSTCFKIGKMAGREKEAAVALQWIERAASLDPAYRRGYQELAGHLFSLKAYDAVETVLEAGVETFPEDPSLSNDLAEIRILLGETLRDSGDVEKARSKFNDAAALASADPKIVGKARSLLLALPSGEKEP